MSTLHQKLNKLNSSRNRANTFLSGEEEQSLVNWIIKIIRELEIQLREGREKLKSLRAKNVGKKGEVSVKRNLQLFIKKEKNIQHGLLDRNT